MAAGSHGEPTKRCDESFANKGRRNNRTKRTEVMAPETRPDHPAGSARQNDLLCRKPSRMRENDVARENFDGPRVWDNPGLSGSSG